MSKKIIYLLSLLMALSLVFASCKKNGLDPNNIGGGGGKDDTTFTPSDSSHGFLTQEELQEFASKYIEDKVVLAGNANEFSRNPVIAVMGTAKDTVLIVSERRYDSPGSINDIGLDGVNKTDLYYVVGTKSGTTMNTPGVVGAAAKDAKTSHAAPVLFKINDTDVIIVASTSAGISRTTTAYGSRNVKSGLQYIAGKLNGTKMDWGQWTDLEVDSKTLDKYIETTTEINNLNKPQFGTHSARGYIDNSSQLILPVVLADQGVYTQTGVKEQMAVLFLTGTVSQSGINAKVTWEKATSYPTKTFDQDSKYSKYKESRVIGGEDGNLSYLLVPSPSYSGKTMKLGIGQGNNITEGSMNAGEGSMGYLKLTEGWYGTETYDPQNYKAAEKKAGIVLFSHVTSAETDLKLYVFDTTTGLSGQAKNTITIVNKGKSSSIDILGDGTIVTVAEEGLRAGSTKRNDFVVRFSRYTQHYISTVNAKN